MWVEQPYNTEKQTCYFITLNTIDWVDVFIRPVYKQVVVHTLNHFIESKGLIVYSWCLMTNHLHLLVQSKPGVEIADLEYEYCQFTNQKIVEAIATEPVSRREWMLQHFRNNGVSMDCSVWQLNGNRVLINLDDSARLAEYVEYIHENPVRDRFVDVSPEYLYSSARDYSVRKGLVQITKIPAVEQLLSLTEKFNNSFIVKHIRI